jgi:putative two-component system response regulator
MARDIVLCHQERWDGNGYPHGLTKTRIPLAARIVAIGDVYDALASRRVYKPALPHEECVAIISAEAGRHFDPELIEVFLKVEKTFREINRRYGEGCASASDSNAGSATECPPAASADTLRELPVRVTRDPSQFEYLSS